MDPCVQEDRRARADLQAEHRRHARCTPSITIIQALLDGGADVHVFDPRAWSAKAVLGPVTYGKNPYEIAAGAEAIVVVTEWDDSARWISAA